MLLTIGIRNCICLNEGMLSLTDMVERYLRNFRTFQLQILHQISIQENPEENPYLP